MNESTCVDSQTSVTRALHFFAFVLYWEESLAHRPKSVREASRAPETNQPMPPHLCPSPCVWESNENIGTNLRTQHARKRQKSSSFISACPHWLLSTNLLILLLPDGIALTGTDGKNHSWRHWVLSWVIIFLYMRFAFAFSPTHWLIFSWRHIFI